MKTFSQFVKESYEPEVDSKYNAMLHNLDDVRKSIPSGAPKELHQKFDDLFDYVKQLAVNNSKESSDKSSKKTLEQAFRDLEKHTYTPNEKGLRQAIKDMVDYIGHFYNDIGNIYITNADEEDDEIKYDFALNKSNLDKNISLIVKELLNGNDCCTMFDNKEITNALTHFTDFSIFYNKKANVFEIR